MQSGFQAAITQRINSVCQHYRLLSLAFKKGKTIDFSAFVVQIIPTSLWTASVMIQGEGGLYAPIDSQRFSTAGEVKELTYRLTAWNETGAVTEDYRHKIEHKMALGSVGISRKGSVKLFEIDSLNLVLRTRAFPGQKCLQFVC